MRFLKKKVWIFLALLIVTLFLVTRLDNLLGLPIFTDEAIYVRWAQIASHDAAWRFISLTDGKQPMFIWIAMILMKLIHDPLFAGRIVSVISGFFSMVGIFFLTSEVFKNRKIGLLSSLIYILYPFSLVYDRMALYDSLVAMFMIWSLYFEILLVRHLRLDLALILGMIVGGGMLTKTNADFALILLPFLLIVFNFKDKKWKTNLAKLAVFSVVVTGIANIMYAILRLSPFYHIIEAKNYVFIYPLSEWLVHPLTYVIPNMSALLNWLVIYLTMPFLTLIVAAFLVGSAERGEKKYSKEKLLLVIWFVVPLIALALFGRLIYPRHILFMTMPLLVLGSYALYHLILFARKAWLQILVFVVFLTMFVINDFFIITDFAKAAVPTSDKGQFILSWPAGQGVKETVAFLSEKAKSGKIYVGTEGTFGLMPYALEIYLVDNPNIVIKGFWPMTETLPKEVAAAAKKMPTYFVFYQSCLPCVNTDQAPAAWPVKLLAGYRHGDSNSYLRLYQIENR